MEHSAIQHVADNPCQALNVAHKEEIWYLFTLFHTQRPGTSLHLHFQVCTSNDQLDLVFNFTPLYWNDKYISYIFNYTSLYFQVWWEKLWNTCPLILISGPDMISFLYMSLFPCTARCEYWKQLQGHPCEHSRYLQAFSSWMIQRKDWPLLIS